MRITVFGSNGKVGSRVVSEALIRGHHVTAVVRCSISGHVLPPNLVERAGDVRSPNDVSALSNGQDLVISATRPVEGKEQELVETAKALLEGVARTNTRLLLMGGAGSLIVPNSNGTLVIDDPKYVQPAWRPIAQACTDQLSVCLKNRKVDWAYLSPAAFFEPGERTGKFRVGDDELLVEPDGSSRISMEDAAVALLDEAENPKYHRARFTIGY